MIRFLIVACGVVLATTIGIATGAPHKGVPYAAPHKGVPYAAPHKGVPYVVVSASRAPRVGAPIAQEKSV